MIGKLWLILFFVTSSARANDEGYVCNNGTHHECLCYKGDGQLVKQYPDCHAFLGEQTLLIMQISLKFNTSRSGKIDRRRYEHIFKRYIIANLITKYCLRQGQQKNKHCRDLDLPLPFENIVILKLSCADGRVSVVDMAIIKHADQKLLTNVNTISPNFLIKVVNGSLSRKSLKHVKLIDIGTTYFAIPRSPLFAYRNSDELHDDHIHNTPFYISLVVLALAIISICTLAALKVWRDRAKAKKANEKPYAGKHPSYGSTKIELPVRPIEQKIQEKANYSTPEINNIFGDQVQTTAIVAFQRSPTNSIPSTTFVENYPQIQADDQVNDDYDYQKTKSKRSQSLAGIGRYVKSVKMTSKASIFLRKIVSDYVLSRKRVSPESREDVEISVKPTVYGSVGISVNELGDYHKVKLNNLCGKSKSDNNLSKYTEIYPKVPASKTIDILANIKTVDRIEEEPIEVCDIKNVWPDEVLSVYRVTCNVPRISITTSGQNCESFDIYDFLNQTQATPTSDDDIVHKPDTVEFLNASETSSCRETDTESEDESENDKPWDYTLSMSSSNYQQLCESQISMNRMDSGEE